jgi:calcineurin-like phosphoesterase family protein
MSKTIWFTSDLHLGHTNPLRWTDAQGNYTRPFSSIDEFHQLVIYNYNSLVNPQDTVYFLGDICTRKSYLPLLKKFTGNKRLVLGNHDANLPVKSFLPYFGKIYGVKYLPQKLVLTHMPVWIDQYWLERKPDWVNVHGHIHHNPAPTSMHFNACLEVNNWSPVHIDQVVQFQY